MQRAEQSAPRALLAGVSLFSSQGELGLWLSQAQIPALLLTVLGQRRAKQDPVGGKVPQEQAKNK